MRKSIVLLLAASVAVSSCGWRDSRANPRNWFGGAEEVELSQDPQAPVNPLLPAAGEERGGLFSRADEEDNSVLIASVTGLRVERTSTGAIIYSEGLATRQGAYNVHLRPDQSAADGTLAFQFRADYPLADTPAGSELTRTVRAAVSLSDGDMEGVRLIRVTGAQNAQETRRR